MSSDYWKNGPCEDLPDAEAYALLQKFCSVTDGGGVKPRLLVLSFQNMGGYINFKNELTSFILAHGEKGDNYLLKC